jgi:hypothetical protein
MTSRDEFVKLFSVRRGQRAALATKFSLRLSQMQAVQSSKAQAVRLDVGNMQSVACCGGAQGS